MSTSGNSGDDDTVSSTDTKDGKKKKAMHGMKIYGKMFLTLNLVLMVMMMMMMMMMMIVMMMIMMAWKKRMNNPGNNLGKKGRLDIKCW